MVELVELLVELLEVLGVDVVLLGVLPVVDVPTLGVLAVLVATVLVGVSVTLEAPLTLLYVVSLPELLLDAVFVVLLLTIVTTWRPPSFAMSPGSAAHPKKRMTGRVKAACLARLRWSIRAASLWWA